MQQYREIKDRHQDAILFFRMGDFYEMFYEDAEVASRALGLTLTSRNNGGSAEVPLAGVPVKAAGEYLRRLVQQGFRVSICEQTEDPKHAKGIVRREVVETITPGAAFADDMLDRARNNYLCAVFPAGDLVGIAAADLSTGEFRLIVSAAGDTDSVLARLSPREILVGRSVATSAKLVQQNRKEGALVTEREAWEFDAALAAGDLAKQFGVASVEGLGIDDQDAPALAAAGALMRYLQELQPGGMPHLSRPKVERPGGTMPLDEMTRHNLELVESLRGSDTEGTLISVLDRTQTPMGSRLLRHWILTPLVNREAIVARLDAVSLFSGDPVSRQSFRESLDGVRDIERLAGKAAAGRGNPRDLRALGDSIARLPAMRAALDMVSTLKHGDGALSVLMERWDECADLALDITGTLVERPPAIMGEELCIRPGIDASLDEWRSLRDGGKDAIARIQMDERARTGIQSLKVGYNRVFGYFIEITNSNSHLVPADYQRRQTLTGAERYVTPALKEHEEKVLTAAERIEDRERELFEALRRRIGTAITRLQCVAQLTAELDVLATLAEVAEREGYTRPEIDDGFDLEIVAGRHPVVERMMSREKFIPNDVRLSEGARMIILTGPNMAGKSTVLRQIGLIVLMAQMGSFVPAASARIGVVDRLFTRVGASDNLVRGQSTFMVEMSETSAILHTATGSSLVLLDEIGRGTSTYDGVSIAWSVSEYLHDEVKCKTVFATHYHELTQLTDELVAACNYSVEVREAGDQVLFLHRLVPGGANRSYGIEVGRLAGLPATVLDRAKTLLALFEGEQIVSALGDRGSRKDAIITGRNSGAATVPAEGGTAQLGLFGMSHPIVDELRKLDPDTLTPLDALLLVNRLVASARQG